MSCRLSARGHRWREAELAARRLRPNPTLRICECGATGYVSRQGVVEVDWEPAKLEPLKLVHPCDRSEVRAIVLELGELEVEYRDKAVITDAIAFNHRARRDELVRRLMEHLG
jgi:hypothetical protein